MPPPWSGPVASAYDALNRPKKPHVIEEISFRKDYILCSCSFAGTVIEYDEHRREMNRLREAERLRRRAEQEERSA